MTIFSNKDTHWLAVNSNKALSPTEKALVEATFDTETNYDEQLIKVEMAAIKKIKKMAIIKLFMFVPEGFLANILYTKKDNVTRRALNNLYFKLLFNKINYNDFKKDLINISKNDIILI